MRVKKHFEVPIDVESVWAIVTDRRKFHGLGLPGYWVDDLEYDIKMPKLEQELM